MLLTLEWLRNQIQMISRFLSAQFEAITNSFGSNFSTCHLQILDSMDFINDNVKNHLIFYGKNCKLSCSDPTMDFRAIFWRKFRMLRFTNSISIMQKFINDQVQNHQLFYLENIIAFHKICCQFFHAKNHLLW